MVDVQLEKRRYSTSYRSERDQKEIKKGKTKKKGQRASGKNRGVGRGSMGDEPQFED
jgi:hypothetical protein